MMELDVFRQLIEKLTDDFRTVEYEFNTAYITETIKAKVSKEYDNRPITDILSDYFDVNVTSWHSDTDEEYPCIWIIYEEK